jgi:glycosyltransferase involved in cell wall biosynthesis
LLVLFTVVIIRKLEYQVVFWKMPVGERLVRKVKPDDRALLTSKYEARVKELEHMLAQRSDQINALQRLLVKRDEKIGNIEQKIGKVERKLSELQSSLSWRATRPLRAVSRQLVLSVIDPVASYWRLLCTKPGAIRTRLIARVIYRSGKFDRQWYLSNNPDVAAAGIDPIRHYVLHGVKEGRDPSPSFSTRKYLAKHPDVAAAGTNPFWHFIRHGKSDLKRLMSSGLFDVNFYLRENPDVRKSGIDPAEHFLRYGGAEGRDPSPLFDTEWYWWATPNVGRFGVNPLFHFLRQSGVRNRLYKKGEFRSTGWTSAGRTVREALVSSANASPLNIVFVNHASFNNNSAGQIAGLANALVRRGHNVVMCARGSPEKVNDFGLPEFRMVSRADLMRKPQILRDLFADSFKHAPTLIHCWTARENVRMAASPAIGAFQIPYFVHFEDNEEFVTRAELELAAEGVRRLSDRDWEQRVPSALSHPLRASSFASGAAGATIIVDALRQLCPSDTPAHVLEPGLNLALLSSPIDETDRLWLCHKFNIPLGACIISYTGNLHRANVREMLELYAAIQELNRRGINVHLLRTGSNCSTGFREELDRLSAKHVTELGLVDCPTLMEVFSLADIFVQPGRPDEFNDYRLPCKLPNWLASGRPVVLPATNVGLRLRDGVDCLLLRRGDRMEIADRVAALAHDKELGHRLAKSSRQFALQNFSWDRSAEGLETFYRETLKARGI